MKCQLIIFTDVIIKFELYLYKSGVELFKLREVNISWIMFTFRMNCHNPNDNTTQPQDYSWVGHENDCAHPTPHHPTPTHPTTENQL